MTETTAVRKAAVGSASGTLIGALAQGAALARPAALCFPEAGDRIDLRTLWQASQRCAQALRASGVTCGSVVGLLAAAGPEFIIGFFGVLRAGASVSVLPTPVGGARAKLLAEQTARIVRTAQMQFVVHDAGAREFTDELTWLCPGLTVLRPRPEYPGGADLPVVEGDDLAVVQFTSGSTGRPRGVMLTHRNVVAGLQAIVECAGMHSEERLVQWVPPYHDMGLFGMLSHLLVAHGDVHMFQPGTFIRHPLDFLRYVAEQRGHLVTGPNFSFELMLNSLPKEEAPPLDLSAWRLAFNGAEPISAALVEAFAARLAPAGLDPAVMYPVYGMAEATLAVSFPRPGSLPRTLDVDRDELAATGRVRTLPGSAAGAKRIVSVGRPVPGMQVRIVDTTGTECGPGHLGELHIRGASVTTGYFRDEEATRAAFDGAWLRTGDLGFTLDGELYVAGRSKEMAIVHGRNLFPDDIEAVARDTPGVFRRRCVAYAGSGTSGEYVGVVAETAQPEQTHPQLAEEIRRRIVGELGGMPLRVDLVGPRWLTKTTSGKWQRVQAGRRISSLNP